MKRVIVICEGQTEQEFCNTILNPYFSAMGVFLNAPIIKHSYGGIVPWQQFSKQIRLHLKSDKTAYVTTLIDYYGITEKHNFPRWEESKLIVDSNARMDFLENAMRDEMDDSVRHRFLPYIQLHEFEGLLFSDPAVFARVIPQEDLVGQDELRKTVEAFDNPEMINTSKQTSQSHRLERIIRGYDKVVYGNYLAENIGLNRIRERCPRFNAWVAAILALPKI